MIKIKRILFPTDFSKCAEQAFLYAVFLAEQTGAQLHMLHVNVLHGYDPNNPDYRFPEIDESIQNKLNEAVTEHMKSEIKKAGAHNISVRKIQERSISAAPAVLDYTVGNDIDLIVMGTHGRRGMGHMLLGSVTEEVVRLSRCPVLTVRERKEAAQPEDISKILVPVDFSDHSRDALSHAREIAGVYDAEIQLLYIIEEPLNTFFYELDELTTLRTFPEVEERSRNELDAAFRKSNGPDVPVDFFVIEGRPKTDIVKFAQSNGSDLIVISTHGLTAIEELLVGSTTEKVVRHSVCPVFTVPAFGRSVI